MAEAQYIDTAATLKQSTELIAKSAAVSAVIAETTRHGEGRSQYVAYRIIVVSKNHPELPVAQKPLPDGLTGNTAKAAAGEASAPPADGSPAKPATPVASPDAVLVSLIGETISADITRRYSDFTWLYDQLATAWPSLDVPVLPPKAVLAGTTDPAHVQRRQRGLQRFLDQVCASAPLLASRATVDFLSLDTASFAHTKATQTPTAAGRAANIMAGAGSVMAQVVRRAVRGVTSAVGGTEDLDAAGHQEQGLVGARGAVLRLSGSYTEMEAGAQRLLDARRQSVLQAAALAKTTRGVGRTETGGFGKALEAMADEVLQSARANKRVTDGVTPWIGEEATMGVQACRQLDQRTFAAALQAGETRRDAAREVDAASAAVAQLLSAGGEPPSAGDEGARRAYDAAVGRLRTAMRSLGASERGLDAHAAHAAAESSKSSRLRLAGLRSLLLDMATAESEAAEKEAAALAPAVEAARKGFEEEKARGDRAGVKVEERPARPVPEGQLDRASDRSGEAAPAVAAPAPAGGAAAGGSGSGDAGSSEAGASSGAGTGTGADAGAGAGVEESKAAEGGADDDEGDEFLGGEGEDDEDDDEVL